MTTFACGQCGATLAFPDVRSTLCPYCASGSWVERPPAPDRPDPTLIVAFTGTAEAARRALDRWLATRWFADSALRAAHVDSTGGVAHRPAGEARVVPTPHRLAPLVELRGVYVPAYLYSAAAHTTFTAQIGETYTEVETREVRDKPRWRGRGPVPIPRDDQTRTETRTVTRTEYRPLSGNHVGYVTDVVVGASAVLAAHELAALGPFDLRLVRRYAPEVIAGWVAEEFARPADDCRRASRAEAIDRVGDELRAFMPGDSHSDLAWRTTVEWESLDPILVPVWVLAVRYRADRPALRVAVNGQTGKVTGRVPRSWRKIALALAGVAAAALAIAWLVEAL